MAGLTAQPAPPPLPQTESPGRPRGSMVWYCLRWSLFTLVTSIALSVALDVAGLTGDSEGPFEGLSMSDAFVRIVLAIGTLVISPVVETLGLAAMIGVMSWITRQHVWRVVLPAAVWCVCHSLLWPPWGIIVAPLFLVCAHAYLVWRPVAWWRALYVATLIHAFHNVLPTIAILTMAE